MRPGVRLLEAGARIATDTRLVKGRTFRYRVYPGPCALNADCTASEEDAATVKGCTGTL